jgi:esterase/lipase superfamily enzyme
VALVTAWGPHAHGETKPGTETDTATTVASEDDAFRTVPFITLRNRTGSSEAAEFFGDERNTLTAGYCDVVHTPLKPLQPIAKNASFYIPDEIVSPEAIRVQALEYFWRDLHETSNGRRPVLYTHGYYISFERGCKRASIFQRSLGLKGRFLLFSWPSDGAILNYTRDESDLYWSVAPMGETLTDMIDTFGAGGFDIAAHSLGTRGVFLALLRMADGKRSDKPLINQVVLIAPDIDAGIFEQNLSHIKPLVGNITIYVSSNDKPLALSRQVHGYPRLGEAGPHLGRLRGVEIIDLSDIGVRYPSGHVYHLYNPTVVSDLNALLIEGKSAKQRTNLKRTGRNYWRLQPEIGE